MRKLLLVGLLCWFGQVRAQLTTYLNEKFAVVEQGSHTYYRIVKESATPGMYHFTTYYKSGQVQRQGMSSSSIYANFDGPTTEFWENGNPKRKLEYKKGRAIGKIETWYEDGKPRLIGDYAVETMGQYGERDYRIREFWNTKGGKRVVAGNGYFADGDEEFYEEGNVVNGMRVGPWKGKNYVLDLDFEETYDENGLLISGKSHDSTNEYSYTISELRPSYNQDISSFNAFIAKNFHASEENDYSGRMLFSFIIEKDGSVQQIKAVKSGGPENDAEAIRVIRAAGSWTPGSYKGKPIRTSFAVPITVSSGN